jgi:glutaredoxin 3
MSVEIYGKPACPFCEKAKALCEIRHLSYNYYQIEKDFTREELFEQFPGARTFPQIKINDRVIGGYEQLVTYIEETGYNGTGHSLGT